MVVGAGCIGCWVGGLLALSGRYEANGLREQHQKLLRNDKCTQSGDRGSTYAVESQRFQLRRFGSSLGRRRAARHWSQTRVLLGEFPYDCKIPAAHHSR